jgi:Uncharacterized protein conserved in bacteria
LKPEGELLMYYEHNMNLIKLHRSMFYDLLQEKFQTLDQNEISIETLNAKNKEKTLQIKKDGLQIRLNSLYSPTNEAMQWAEQLKMKNLDSIITMFGMGSGIFLNEIKKKTGEDNAIIVFEPSFQIFNYVLQEFDMEEIIKDERIVLIVMEINFHEFPYMVNRLLGWLNLFSKIECFHPGYDKLFPEEYTIFKDTLRDNAFNNIIAKNTNMVLGKVLVENAMENLPFLKDSLSIWDLSKELPKDVPVIIAAAGPSLNINIDQLKEAKGKAIIVAVDRAYEMFIAHDIEPDFVVLMDPRKKLEHCGGQKGFKAPLICKLEASPEVMNNHKGTKIIYNCEDFIAGIYKEIGTEFLSINAGGSVTTAAFAIFAKLGFETLILMGLDLAYAGEASHAGNHQEDIKNDDITIYVEDIHGNQVKSRHDWYTFLRWFENVILQMDEYTVIDASEGGAKIKGTQIMPLKEAIDKHCKSNVDCAKLMKQVKPSFDEASLLTVYQYLNTAIDDLNKIRELSTDAEKSCKSYLDNHGKKKLNQQKLLKKVSSINDEIQEKPIYSLIDSYVLGMGADSVGELSFMTTDKETDEYVTYKNMVNIYHVITESCNFIQPKLEEVIKDYH